MDKDKLRAELDNLSINEILEVLGRDKLAELVRNQVLLTHQVQELLGTDKPLSRTRLRQLENDGKLEPVIKGKATTPNIYLRVDIEARAEDVKPLREKFYRPKK